jgi:hypothetical protein
MALTAFKKFVSKNLEINWIQNSIAAVLNQLTLNPFLTGVHLTALTTTVGGSSFAHKLGRTPIGWIVTDITNDQVFIYRTAWNDTTITFGVVDDTGTPSIAHFSVWVF